MTCGRGSGKTRHSRIVCESKGKDAKVKLRLKLAHQVSFGEQHGLMGANSIFGKWNKLKEMEWSEEGWSAEFYPSPGDKLEFKYVIVGRDGNVIWESGDNRMLEIPVGASGEYELVSEWDRTAEAADTALVQVRAGEPVQKRGSEPAPPRRSAAEEPASSSEGSAAEVGSPSKLEEPSSFLKAWQGRDAVFMRSNEHSRERKGVWNEEGLTAGALQIVRGDKSSGSWWRKLEIVKELVTGSLGKGEPIPTLVNSSIYLQWINTGAIPCAEDGGHHRPNRPAEISRKIFRELEWMMAAKDTTQQTVLVLRRIHRRLPAFTAEFTASVPLTRIRDIAHRNDIPHELKQEIKHTIQNKLHRNAGPEDLVATEVLLNRVTAEPGQYSAAFVEQLSLFYAELKNFFNASTLTERLEGIRVAMDEQLASVLNAFLERKKKLDNLDVPPPPASTNSNGNGRSVPVPEAPAAAVADAAVGCLHALTGLRAELLGALESGLRNDASDDALAMRQKWRLSEIGLEEYSFVLISRFVNALEASGGSSALASEARGGNVSRFNHPLGVMVLGVRQLGLSGWQPAECLAVENELSAWQAVGLVSKEDAAAFAMAASRAASNSQNGNTPSRSTNGNGMATSVTLEATEEDIRLWALRLKATLERARRLADSYSDTLLSLYADPSKKLGNALGVAENSVRTFAEAEIRESVVYQLSRLCSLLLKATRTITGGEGWDPLNAGTATGKLVAVDEILPGKIPQGAPVILLVKNAHGDEEVKAAGDNVAGVILCHELPHLSHLGVRARQEGVPFVTCTDEDKVRELQGMAGKTVRLEVHAERVSVEGVEGQEVERKLKEPKELAMAGQRQQQQQQAAIKELGGWGDSMIGVGARGAGRIGTTRKRARGQAARGRVGGAGDIRSPQQQPQRWSGSPASRVLAVHETAVENSGAKAAGCGHLAMLAPVSSSGKRVGNAPATFRVPAGACIPFGTMEEALERSVSCDMEEFRSTVEMAETATPEAGELDRICNRLQFLVSNARLSSDAIAAVGRLFPDESARLIVRSSANVEDLAGMSGAGLYESVPNVRWSEPHAFSQAVAHVWASLYTRRAVLSRRAAGIPQREATMAVLVQELLSPSLSFVLHTVSPVDRNKDVMEAEIALGLGETLAAGTKGSPWRLAINKTTGEVRTLSFANMSEALFVGGAGEGSGAADGRMLKRPADYSTEPLSVNARERVGLGQRLAAIGLFLEEQLNEAQDIEGCVVGGDIYIVQSRPQPR